MAFPTLGILDDFNRANEDPLAGGWAGPIFTGERQLRIVSNEATVNGTDNYGNSYWNTVKGPDCEAYCTLTTNWVAGDRIVFYLRSTVGASVSGYRVNIRDIAGDDLVFIERIDGGSVTNLTTIDPADTFAIGDSFGAEIIGDTITAYRKPSGGSWASLGTADDTASTYPNAGYLGLALTTAGVNVDNFGGGTIVTVAPTTILRPAMVV